MGVSIVKLTNGETLVDMSDATITEDTVLEGYTGYGANGELIVGKAASTKRTEVTITLPASGWSSKQQTVSVSAVTADSSVFSQGQGTEYSRCGVECTTQAAGSLTFACTTTPTTNLSVKLAIFT